MHDLRTTKRPELSEKEKQRRREVKNLAVSVLNTPEGKKLLEYFQSITTDNPVVNFNLPGDRQLSEAARRDGENNFVRYMINLAKPRKDTIDK